MEKLVLTRLGTRRNSNLSENWTKWIFLNTSLINSCDILSFSNLNSFFFKFKVHKRSSTNIWIVILSKQLTPRLLEADDVHAAHGRHLDDFGHAAVHGVDLVEWPVIISNAVRTPPPLWAPPGPFEAVPGPGRGRRWAARCGAGWAPRGPSWEDAAAPAPPQTRNPSAQSYAHRRLPRRREGGPASCSDPEEEVKKKLRKTV